MDKDTVISILTLNNRALLKQCLESIFENTESPYRVCVIDQATTDGTRDFLDGLGGRLDVVHSAENLGFIGGNNLVMDRYPENDVVLLNDDTIVKPGWLKALHDCAYSDPAIGIVGAKLLYPDGTLQEAGGEIFQDGSGRNIGKNDDANRFIYNVRKDVDYCSGACLFLKREVLSKIGYLDEIFSPAYWEDTDICFRARKAGFRVVYEPEAQVIHLEGGTTGLPGQDSLSKKLQARNKPKFMARWAKELTKHRKNAFEVRTSSQEDKILVILPFLPMYDRAAGEKRWFHTLKILKKYYDVVLLARNGAGQLKYINELERMGITVFHTDESRLKHMGCDLKGPLWIDFPLLLRSNDFKAVIVGFYHVAHQYYRDIRKHSPKSVLIIDSYDLCFLRERRKAELSGDPGEIWKALEIKRQELSMYRNADMVLTVTEEDRRKLIEEAPDLSVGISTDIHPVEAAGTCADRKDLLFVGNYNHDPNVDAVLYFVEEIFPRIKQQLPDVKLRIVGNAPTERIKQLAADDIIVTGFVPEVTPYLLESRVFVVPLRYGAGLKGKIGEALGCGIPIVTTSIGAEGMNLVHRKNSMIADDPESFARCVIEVCGDDSLCGTLSREGQEHAKRNYSFETVEEYWKEVIEFIGRGRREGPKRIREKRVPGFTRPASVPELAPEVGIVVPVHDNLDVTRSCWASIRKNTGIPYDLVLVDNGSAEDVAYEADQNNIRVIRNDSNKGFAHACNQGIRHTHGDFVVILNNDTIATPGWLERLVWHARGDARIGIVGPSTSFAAGPQQIPTSYRSEKDLYDFSEGLYSKNRHSHVDVDKVVGVCMVLRRAMLEDVGLFDTRFGIGNYEDDDICLRARLGGYRVVWAKDVFVHHKGSVTFRSIGMDYGKIIEENRQKYISKWAPVAAEFAPQGGVARAARPRVEGDSTMVVVGDGRTDAAETVKTIEEYSERPAIALARCLPVSGERSDLMVIAETDGSPLSRTVIEFVEASQGDAVFFVRAGAVLTPGWTKPLEAALADETVGCALPSCNVGWGEQLEKPTYSKTGKPLVKFARRNALKWRGTVTDIEIGFPAALAISRKNLVKHGLPGEFVTSASLLDLQRRVSDSGLRVVCARDSYVHMDGRDTELWATERDAVTNLLDARKAVARECVDAAIQHLDHAIRFKPDYAEALYERGVLRALKGMDDDAASDFDGVLRAVPSDSRAHNNLGCIHFRRGRTGDAEKSFKTAIEVDNENWEAKKNLADLHMSTGRPDSATSLYSSIIEEHGECPDVYASLGEVFAAHGDLATAEYLFKIALRLSPDNVAAKQGLGVVDLARANLNNAGGEGLGESRAEPLSLHDSPE